jgi:17beta-estradiol 17-dehydrogenase / very-long-chain 3-oxoacyl-CoA reductase
MFKYSALECFGLVAIAGIISVILAEAWKLLYTCFLGHALGHSLSFKNIGRWAGKNFF